MKRCCDLDGLGHIEVQGRKVGVVGLRQIVEEVSSLGISDKRQVTEELLRRVEETNYVPPEERQTYGAALYAHYLREVNTNG